MAQHIVRKNRVKLCTAKTQRLREVANLKLHSFGNLAGRSQLLCRANARLIDVYTQHVAFDCFRDLQGISS